MNLATLWLLLTKRRESLLLVIAGIALFGSGWHAGRIMSPYYAAQPIVFQEAVGEGSGSANNGDPAALLALREASEPGSSSSEEVKVAGVQDRDAPDDLSAEASAKAEALAEGEEESSALFVGSVNSDLYHHKTCTAWLRIHEENRRWFQTQEEAEAAGYKPSKCTQEVLGI